MQPFSGTSASNVSATKPNVPFGHFSKSFTLARYVKKCSVYTLTHDISSTLLRFGPGGYTPENFDDVQWPERQLETILSFA